MKNVVLVDFTPESIEALTYAIGFTKACQGELDILNVTEIENTTEGKEKLEKLKTNFSDSALTLNAVELVGNMEEAYRPILTRTILDLFLVAPISLN